MKRTAEESGGIAGRADWGNRQDGRHLQQHVGPIAAAALILLGVLAPGPAQALTLGGMTVQSNLGEPLRAQVQVSDLTPAESASLTVQSASPAAFQAAGIEYSAALAGMQVTLERRAGNQAVVRITGNRPANEPFLEVLLEASWAGGRLSRNYTVLLDPPTAGQRTPPAPLAPQITPAPPPAPALSPPLPAPAPAPVIAPRPAPAPATPRPAPQARPPVAAPAPAAGGQTTVRPGDTAGRIAARTRSPNVSLDQMLVAMLQANPDAFIDGNVNRIRSGAVLNVPSEADAAATPAPEARQIVIAQSRDFNEFRRRLAAGAPAVASAAPQRQASGSVQTQVEDRRPNAAAPDRLTLSKGTANTQAAAEAERVARAKQEADSKQRLAELSRNVDELNRLGTTTGSSATPATTPPAPAPAPEAAAPAPAPATAPPPPAEPPAAPKPPAPIKAPVPAPLPDTGTSFLDESPLGDPKVLGVVGLLVALVVALVSYRVVRRRRGISTDAGFVDKKNPDSFFADTRGEHVDTADGGPSTLATSYSPSQLDAGGEVDPIAEADVYLAYGRDLQAEDILKEALRNHPDRTALHAKLAEIYAKRKDVAAFNTLAGEAHRQTGGIGADWERIQALGEDLDPTNSLFRSAGSAAGAGAAASISAAALAALAAAPPTPVEPEPMFEPEAEPVVEPAADLDLDLDFNLDDPAPAAAPAPSPAAPVELPPSLDLDFGAFTPDTAEPPAPAAAPSSNDQPDFGLDFNLDDDLDFDGDFNSPPPVTDAEPLPSLDLSSFSLDLDEDDDTAPAPPPPASASPPAETPAPDEDLPDMDLPDVAPDDALATKLALAEEFNAIGDVDGARHLIEEVIAEASGSVRERAERMLSSLQ